MAMTYTYGPLLAKNQEVYALKAQIVALEEQVVVLNEQNVALQGQIAGINEQLMPTFVDEFAANETWGAITYALDIIKTDFAANEFWAPSTEVLYEADYARDTDMDLDTDDWSAITA